MIAGGCILQLFPSQTSQNKQVFMFMRVTTTKGRIKGSPRAFLQDVVHSPGLPSTLSLMQNVCTLRPLGDRFHLRQVSGSHVGPRGFKASEARRHRPQQTRLGATESLTASQAPLVKAIPGDLNVTTELQIPSRSLQMR